MFTSNDQSPSLQSESVDSVHSLKSSHLGHHHEKESGSHSSVDKPLPQRSHTPEEQSQSELGTFRSSNLSQIHNPSNLKRSTLVRSPLDIHTPRRKKSVQFEISHSYRTDKDALDAFQILKPQNSQRNYEEETEKSQENIENKLDAFKVKRSSAIIKAFDEQVQAKEQQRNTIILGNMIEPTLNSAINQIINQRHGANESAFANMWSNVFFLVQTYNFFTCFFFIGIQGYPEGWWYVLELTTEILMILDFIGRWVIRVCFPLAWQEMYLLHDRGGITKFNFTIRLIASVPFSMIISSSVGDNTKVLKSVSFALLRLLKLLKFGQVMEYFNVVDFKKRQISSYSINRSFYVLYYFLCFNHFFASLWLFCARVDHVHLPKGDSLHGVGWLFMDKLHMYAHTVYDLYRDSIFFCFSTMNGQNWGNIWATTDLEFFIHSIIDIAGASVFIGYFLTFATEWTLRSIPLYENQQKYELVKQFCEMQSLPIDLRQKIRYYYTHVRLDFIDYNQKHRILQELPYSIQKEVAMKFNQKVLQSVKLFQIAPQEFVERIACLMKAEVSIAGDFVVRINEKANKMYFVQNGSLEVLASDNLTTISLIGSGTYFGEIGVLITGKRSASVRAISNCMTYSVGDQELLQILIEYPEQEKFLRAVGFQRLNTTNPVDISQVRPEQSNQNQASGLFDDDANIRPTSSIRTVQLTKNFSFLRRYEVPIEKSNTTTKKSTKWWLTLQYSDVQHFVIMPFSYVFYFWSAIMVLTFTYVSFKVLFGVGWDQNFAFDPLLIIAEIIYIADIPIRMYTGIAQPNRTTVDLTQVSTYYINSWLLADLIATIPVEYILQNYLPHVSRWLMLIKLIKVVRINETLQIFLHYTNRNQFYIMFCVYIYLFAFLSHLCACGYAFICFRSIKNSSRFDGDSMIANYAAKAYSQQRIDKLDTQTQYWWFMYLATSIVGGQCYGDVTPGTDAEQYWTMFISILGRILLSFILTQTQTFLDAIYKQQSRHFQNRKYLRQWMQMCKLQEPLMLRIQTFSEIQWQNHFQMNKTEILESLPISIQMEIKTYMFTPLIRSWEVITGADLGEIVSIINQLELVTFPENELIVKFGEVADEMYFVVEGICQVESKEGSVLMVLKQGQSFGEVVLLNPDQPLRKSSVRSLTVISLAVLTRRKFNEIVILYPQFRENLDLIVKRREKAYMKLQKSPSEIRMKMLHQLQLSNESQMPKSSMKESSERESARTKNDLPHLTNPVDSMQQELRAKDRNSLPFEIPNKISRKEKVQLQVEQALTTERGLLTEAISEGIPTKKTQVLPEFAFATRPQKRQRSSSLVTHLHKQHTLQLAENLNEQFELQGQKQTGFNTEKCLKRFRQLIVKPIILLVVVWNLLFIPIHQSFKFAIVGPYLWLECITIVVYASEIVYRSIRVRNLSRIQTVSESDLTIKERRLLQEQERLQQKLQLQYVDLVLTLVAILPFNLLFDKTRWPKHIWIQVVLRSLRLAKFRPIPQAFKTLQRINLPLFRVIQVMTYNYFICNLYATVMISIVLDEPDATKNWLRRIPVPSGKGLIGFGVRQDPTIWNDVSPKSLYIHAFYYIQSTLSRVAVGDITPTNLEEFILNVFFVFSVTFLYCTLFSDIASIVSSLTSETQVAFLRNRNNLLSKLHKDVIPQIVIDKANMYFYYQFNKYNGLSETELLDMLPDRIKIDVKLAQYQQMLDSSLLFRDCKTGVIDQTLANTILKTVKLQVYLSEDFVLKAGQQVEDTFLLFEGSIVVFSVFNNENIGILSPGDFYGVDLYFQRDKLEFEREFYVNSQGEQPPRLKLEASDNFDGRAPFHMTAKTFVTIGRLSQTDLNTLYKAFPSLQKSIQKTNRYLFEVGRKQLEKMLEQQESVLTRDACIKILEDNYSNSTTEKYEVSMRMQRVFDQSNANDLSHKTKMYYLMLQKPKHQKELKKYLFAAKKIENLKQGRKSKITCCCEDFLIEEQSKMKRVLQLLHLINMIYISFATPLQVAFDVKIRDGILVAEIISSLVSLMIFMLTFRTPYLENGQKSIDIIGITKIYLKNGMIADFLGVLPSNIIVCYSIDVMSKDISRIKCAVAGLVRCTRMLSITQAFTIFEILKLQFKKKKGLVQSVGNITFVFIIGHWLVCLWVFTVHIIEQHEVFTWFTMLELDHRPIWAVYMINWYAVLNIVTGAGMGDVFAVTDTERVFFILAMNAGDILLAIVFGIIEHMVLSHRLDDETENFIQKMVQIEGTMQRFELNSIWKDRVEQFYAYKHKIQSSAADIDATYLEKSLPESLSRQILYYQYKSLVIPLFGQFQSDNLITNVCYYLKSRILLPEDVVFSKRDVGTHMYFCVEGSLNVMSADGKRVLNTIQAGGYFGEVALFTRFKRNTTVKATTFCLLKEISLEDLNSILSQFPKVRDDLTKYVEFRHKQQLLKIQAPLAMAEQINQECFQLIAANNAVVSFEASNSSHELSSQESEKPSKKREIKRMTNHQQRDAKLRISGRDLLRNIKIHSYSSKNLLAHPLPNSKRQISALGQNIANTMQSYRFQSESNLVPQRSGEMNIIEEAKQQSEEKSAHTHVSSTLSRRLSDID